MSNGGAVLQLIGLAKKAGRLEIGEEPAGAAVRARAAVLLLLAGDAADNTARRTRHFSEIGKIPYLRVPFSKEELGRATGGAPCAILAMTDAGLAAAVAKKLATEQVAHGSDAIAFLEKRADRVQKRRQEKRSHEKNRRKKQS